MRIRNSFQTLELQNKVCCTAETSAVDVLYSSPNPVQPTEQTCLSYLPQNIDRRLEFNFSLV